MSAFRDSLRHFMEETVAPSDKRIVFHSTPRHASRMNQIEIWFGILARRFIKGATAAPERSSATGSSPLSAISMPPWQGGWQGDHWRISAFAGRSRSPGRLRSARARLLAGGYHPSGSVWYCSGRDPRAGRRQGKSSRAAPSVAAGEPGRLSCGQPSARLAKASSTTTTNRMPPTTASRPPRPMTPIAVFSQIPRRPWAAPMAPETARPLICSSCPAP